MIGASAVRIGALVRWTVGVLALAALPCAICAQQTSARGVVFADANGNGVRDRSERGLQGVAVSNQETVVVTDSTGAFSLPVGQSGLIFVSVPDGYAAVGTFWRKVSTSDAPIAFPLRAQRQPRTFSFVDASDPHVGPASVERMRRFRAMDDSLHPAFTLLAGDLVRDAMSVSDSEAASYFDMVSGEIARFKESVWTVPGNHDHFGIIRSRSHVEVNHPMFGRRMYQHYFGPDYYSFTYGGVHFIGMNSVQRDDSAYYGRIDSVQMAWLERDLALVPASEPVVTFMHIPLVSAWFNVLGYIDMPLVSDVVHINGKTDYRHTVGNVQEVLHALEKHNYPLAIGAHTHAAERLSFETNGQMTRFEQSSAIVGPAQAGPMIVPSGFTLYTVHDGVIDAGKFIPLDPPHAGARAVP
ncbi:MAG: metallophosphoesterase [Gemmatimonadales bacterium]